MHRTLDEQKRRELDRRVAEAERKTGAQIVLAVTIDCHTDKSSNPTVEVRILTPGF